MEGYDVIMLAVLVGATVFGAYKGFAWQVASISAIFASYFIAVRFREPVSEWIGASPPWNMFLAMLLIYIGSSLAIWIAFRFVSDLIDRVRLKEFDRQIGALFGFAKGVILCVIITLFAVTLSNDQRRQTIVHSRSGYYIAAFLTKAKAVIPEEARQVVAPYVATLRGEPPATRRAEREGEVEESWDISSRDEVEERLHWPAEQDSLYERVPDWIRDGREQLDRVPDWMREGREQLDRFEHDVSRRLPRL
jgi:membrane protein required for colicin V production